MAMANDDARSPADAAPAASGPGGAPPRAEIWLDGDVLACACPDCSAPMSIRLWLRLADCWRCGTSIELTEEQQQQAFRLWRRRQQARGEAVAPAARVASEPAPAPNVPARPASPPPLPARAAAPPVPPPETPPRTPWRTTLVGLGSDVLRNLPAWLISLVVHAVGMLVLSMFVISPVGRHESITLATAISSDDLPADLGDISTPEALEFEDPGFEDLLDLTSLDAPGQPQVELNEIKPAAMDLPEIVPTSDNLALQMLVAPGPASLPPGHLLAGRDPRVRAQMLRSQGGTSETEEAVTEGLLWLKRHQNYDGSWSLHAWDKAPGADPRERVDGHHARSDSAATGMALMAFLGAGQTPLEGEHSETVTRGLRWLIRTQRDNGDLRGPGEGDMYAHGQASIALCEAYAMTREDWLRGPAQRSLNFICYAQHRAGGWRYSPREPGDTSVVGWQIIALRSGKMFYLHVPNETFLGAWRFLDRVQTDRIGGAYGYMPGSGATPTMTAEALLCRIFMGMERDHPGLEAGVRYIEEHPPEQEENIYYWYYATQVMHHYGGSPWRKWNEKLREILVRMQEPSGPMAGSWPPRGCWADRGGRLFMTSLAICTLEVYYRHMPMYRDTDAEKLLVAGNPPAGGSETGDEASNEAGADSGSAEMFGAPQEPRRGPPQDDEPGVESPEMRQQNANGLGVLLEP